MENLDKCSFCGRSRNEVKKLYEGIDAYICIECNDIISENFDFDYSVNDYEMEAIKKPFEIVEYLNDYVIGQDYAKKMLAVAVYNHYKRILLGDNAIEKANIMLVGPTGSGKTHIMKHLAKCLDVPLVIADATVLTEAGYVGKDADNVVARLLKVANMDVSAAEKGIIYIDEIDKIASKNIEGRSNARDISGEGVQQALLKIVEGSKVDIVADGSNGVAKGTEISVDTTNILFVCGGAFGGIDKVIETGKNSSAIGFGAKIESKSDKERSAQITSEDLIKYGMIGELMGRLPVVLNLNKLSKDELRKVFVEPKGSLLNQYRKSFKMDGVNLTFSDEAVDFLIEKASDKKIGARGLRSIVEAKMYEIQYKILREKNVKEYIVKIEDLE